MLNPVVSRRQIGGLEDTTGPPVTGGDYCVVVSSPFHCDLDNLDIVDGVHSSSREHMFNLSPLSPTTVYFILQQDKKKAKAEGKQCHAKTMKSKKSR